MDFLFRNLLRLFELPRKIERGIKRKQLLRSFQKVGTHVAFDPLNSVFPTDGKTQIGSNVFIGRNAYWGGEICVGDNVMFGPNVTLVAGNHIFAVCGKSPRFIKPFPGQNSEPIVIEDEVWIGANVVILGNVTVGIGAVVGAGSVVVHDISPFTVAVGNPCRPVRQIFDDDTLRQHLREIGHADSAVARIIARRAMLLANHQIPTIDKTDTYATVLYEPPSSDV